MNIQESLKHEHSKAHTLRIVDFIGNDTARMSELMTCFFDADWRICQRAAWAVGLIGQKTPHLIKPYLKQMLDNLKTPQHNAVLRNTLRVLRDMPDIPDNLLGKIADVSFKFLEDPSVSIAIRAFSMHVLAKICQKIPEFKAELRVLIEDILEQEQSAGVLSAARSTLKQIY